MTGNTTDFAPSDILSILSRASAESTKLLADSLIPGLEPINVVYNRTGLVMLPYTDSAGGTIFHLGEVLIAEARIQIAAGVEGYGACLSLDLEQALAIALLDAALVAGISRKTILQYVSEQATAQADEDDALLRAVEATRAEMETF